MCDAPRRFNFGTHFNSLLKGIFTGERDKLFPVFVPLSAEKGFVYRAALDELDEKCMNFLIKGSSVTDAWAAVRDKQLETKQEVVSAGEYSYSIIPI